MPESDAETDPGGGQAEGKTKPGPLDFTDETVSYEPYNLKEKPYNREKHREGMRGRIAGGLLIGILLLSLFPFVVLFADLPPETRNAPWYSTLAASVDKSISALVGVFGAVTGFYFGAAERADIQRNG